MKKFSIALSLFIAASFVSIPQQADAWIWYVAKKVIKTDKKESKSKNSWWSNEGKDSRGWSANRNDPDRKQLNYRERDWYK